MVRELVVVFETIVMLELGLVPLEAKKGSDHKEINGGQHKRPRGAEVLESKSYGYDASEYIAEDNVVSVGEQVFTRSRCEKLFTGGGARVGELRKRRRRSQASWEQRGQIQLKPLRR